MDQTEENIVTNDTDAVTNGDTENAEAIANDTVNLRVPVVCGNKTVSSVKIGALARQVGSLRGIRMTDLFNTDVDAAAIFLERVTEPHLSRAHLCQCARKTSLNCTRWQSVFCFPRQRRRRRRRAARNASCF